VDFQVLATGTAAIQRSVMRNARLCPGVVALALTHTVSACGGSAVAVSSPVIIKTLDPTSQEGCYLMGVAGDLVTDPTAGTAVIWDMSGRREVVTWPNGWTARSAGSEVEVLNRKGQVAYRTGTRVDLMGGFSNVDNSFVVCGMELAP
jgi:hypothetical protein